MANITNIETDILVATVKAVSFPDGITAAHEQLHNLFPADRKRQYFGISRPEGNINNIVYKAAASVASRAEADTHNLEVFTIPAGKYLTLVINDYTKNTAAISQAFNTLLEEKDIDPNGFCLEVYDTNNEMRCMVPLRK